MNVNQASVKTNFLCYCLFLTLFASAQNNLLDTSSWNIGNGSVPGYFKFGIDTKNIREIGDNPFGNSTLLWKALADGNSIQDGGWNTNYFVVDPSKSFRFTTWVKKTNSNDGNTLFGFHAFTTSETGSSRKLDGTLQNSPYFFWGDLPELNKWYLLVGYAYGHGHSDLNNQGGIYDTNGVKVVGLTDFKLSTSTHWIVHRNYLYNDSNPSDTQFFYGPTIHEINGQEPTIEELISPHTNSPNETLWTSSGSDINYIDGNVGIGTENPGVWKLAVNGNMRAKEIKVETGWADYVFSKEYNLPTLEEVKKHIEEKGHLINIPSARDVEQNGIRLGEMNKLLLEKIEELTLYTIQQEEKLEQIGLLKERIKHLEKIISKNFNKEK
ncbi:hypothetical protein [Costertonia aggregata]|uniref:Uncharacterized protein n=1 Tax=Costertonia aggregata TaxID=343403 RepID=A0A7H9ATJ1_9FLAO|nr:hypothetical protein [Costertonia aggregata]QLG46774.1 hypothetical protein HYG79_15915 [Costertonia aggregata]